MTEPNYINKIDTVPVGDKYQAVEIDKGTIEVGDIVVWSDPDCHYHDESVSESLFIGFVESIYKMDRDDSEPQLGTSFPLGRISIDHHLKAVSGEEIYLNRDGASAQFVDRFLNSEYEKYMNVEWTRNGDFRVSGE